MDFGPPSFFAFFILNHDRPRGTNLPVTTEPVKFPRVVGHECRMSSAKDGPENDPLWRNRLSRMRQLRHPPEDQLHVRIVDEEIASDHGISRDVNCCSVGPRLAPAMTTVQADHIVLDPRSVASLTNLDRSVTGQASEHGLPQTEVQPETRIPPPRGRSAGVLHRARLRGDTQAHDTQVVERYAVSPHLQGMKPPAGKGALRVEQQCRGGMGRKLGTAPQIAQ